MGRWKNWGFDDIGPIKHETSKAICLLENLGVYQTIIFDGMHYFQPNLNKPLYSKKIHLLRCIEFIEYNHTWVMEYGGICSLGKMMQFGALWSVLVKFEGKTNLKIWSTNKYNYDKTTSLSLLGWVRDGVCSPRKNEKNRFNWVHFKVIKFQFRNYLKISMVIATITKKDVL